jgi:hypothetical protein
MQPLRTRRYDAMLSSRLVKGRRDRVTLRYSFFLTLSPESSSTEGRGQNTTKYKQSEGGLSSATVGRRARPALGGGRDLGIILANLI